jgi:AraC family transcriptional regulator
MTESLTALRSVQAPSGVTSPGEFTPFVRFNPSDIARRQFAAWTGIRTDIVNITRREEFAYGARSDHHLLIMCERAERDDGETTIEGLPRSTLREFSRKLSFVPAGHEFQGWQKPRVLTRVTYFYIDPQNTLVDPELGFAEAELQPRLFFFDRDLWETAAKLKAQAEQASPGAQPYAEALGAVLVHEVLRLNNGQSPDTREVRGGLAGWQKSQVIDYVEEHLADDISLAALAEIARLSPFHFARAFKQSFTVPPHRYLTTRRVERAKDLLAQPRLSVTEIGVKVGFGDSSSFSAAFRRYTGTSPTDYRRSLT